MSVWLGIQYRLAENAKLLFFYSQLNVSLFAKSTYNLLYNLYPLKAGWQQLPEFEVKYNTPDDVHSEQRAEEQYNNYELQNLVNRWMPKKVFILVCTSSVRFLGES